MDVISLGKAKQAQQEIKKTQDKLGYGGTEQGLDIRDIYDTTDERLTALEERKPEVNLLNRVGRVSEHTTINLNKHNLRVGNLLNQIRYQLSDMVIDDFEDDSGIDYNQSLNIEYDDEQGVIRQLNSSDESELVLIAEAFDTMSMFFINSLVVSEIRRQVDIDLQEGLFNDTEFRGSLALVRREDYSYALRGTYETDRIALGSGVASIDNIALESTIPEGTNLQAFIAFSDDGVSFTEYSEDFTGLGNYVKFKFELEAAVEDVIKSLQLQIREGNGVYRNNAFMLNDEADNAILKRNLQKYNGFTYDEEKVESYRVGQDPMYRIKRTIDKGWNR